MIHLVLPDNEAGMSLARALQQNGCAEIVESDGSLQLASVDKRMKHALNCLQREKLLVHKYDYIWIMRYINEEHIKGIFKQVGEVMPFIKQGVAIQRCSTLRPIDQYQEMTIHRAVTGILSKLE